MCSANPMDNLEVDWQEHICISRFLFVAYADPFYNFNPTWLVYNITYKCNLFDVEITFGFVPILYIWISCQIVHVFFGKVMVTKENIDLLNEI
jgi:hypothetical protein